MAKQPSFQFYPGDWMKDADLSVCSIFARGLLLDLLCVCFDSKHRGMFVRHDGVTPWTDFQIVDSVRGSDRVQKLAALKELEANSVLKRNEMGILYSARIVRDENLRQIRAREGSKGGSKAAAKHAAKPQQTMQQKPTPSSSSSISSSTSEDDTHTQQTDPEPKQQSTEDSLTAHQLVLNTFNAIAPIKAKLTPKRRKALATRLRDKSWDWQAACEKIPQSKFLNGGSDSGWKINFDWFLQPDSVAKIIEGQYDDRGSGQQLLNYTPPTAGANEDVEGF